MFLKRVVAILSITLSSQMTLSPLSMPASAIGGGESALGDPRVVAIIHWQRNGIGEANCSGALIAPRIVMTSAHCLSRNPLDGKFPSYSTALPKSGVLTELDAPLWVVTPGAKADLSENIPRARAIAQFPSPLYRDGYCLKENPNQCYGPIYDFGVIVLDRALSSNTYRVANVEELRELVQKNSEIVGLGYGLTSHEEYLGKSKRDGIPRKISYKVRSDLLQVDKARFSYYPELMLLQTTYRSGQYTCGGDSGMPGWFEKNGEWIYIGAAGSGMGPECSYAPDDPFWKDPFWSINAGDHYDTAQAYPEEISAAYSFLADQTNKERIEAEAKAAAEKAAAELKAKQEAEAKAAAELRAKQEAEAKAAAELKAKQEAEAKAAAELKAKQEAEAKAAAELRAKQEAEAKAKAEAAKKKTTITCVKGKITKKVTGVNPKCPAGYRKNR